MINYLALLAALTLTCVSGYISIIGLTTIFASPSSFYVIVTLSAALELSKVIAISWLHSHWNVCSKFIKTYLISAIVIMVLLNCMSSFGFLSRAHIENTLNIGSGASEQIQIIDSRISFLKQNVADLDKQIAQIDDAINKMNEKGQSKNSLAAASAQRTTRNALVTKKEEYVKNISNLSQDRIKLQGEARKLEAEIGPIKYIAELVYTNADSNQVEKAVRFIIIILVSVFDPMAVILLISANLGIEHRKKRLIIDEYQGIIEKSLKIDDDVLGELNVAKGKTVKKLNNRSNRKSDRQQNIYKEGYDSNVSADDKRGIERFS